MECIYNQIIQNPSWICRHVSINSWNARGAVSKAISPHLLCSNHCLIDTHFHIFIHSFANLVDIHWVFYKELRRQSTDADRDRQADELTYVANDVFVAMKQELWHQKNLFGYEAVVLNVTKGHIDRRFVEILLAWQRNFANKCQAVSVSCRLYVGKREKQIETWQWMFEKCSFNCVHLWCVFYIPQEVPKRHISKMIDRFFENCNKFIP